MTSPLNAMATAMPLRDTVHLDFPCEFPIKAFGLATSNFDALVVGLIRRHAPKLCEGAVTARLSRHGKYMAVTVRLTATSREQLDAVYRELSACEQVLMAL
jgi:uncharacterized protein